MTTREHAHRLLDAVPDERLDDAVASLRPWTEAPAPGELFDGEPVLRRIRTIGLVDGDQVSARARANRNRSTCCRVVQES